MARQPDFGGWSGPLAGASFVASLVALNALSEERYPTPGAEPSAVRRFFSREQRAARLGAAAQLVCAASLACFTKSAAALTGRRSRGLRRASVAGGALAATSLAASAVATVSLTTSRAKRDAEANALYRVMFVSGGPVHGVGLGLLVGALGRSKAVDERIALASAAMGFLSPLSLVTKPGMAFIPLGRLSGLAIVGVVGARLARR